MTVYINDTEVTMDAGEVPGFTYSLWSFTEPDKVTGSRSTTFKVPATRNVIRALGPWHLGYVADAELPTLRITNGTSILYEGRVIVAKRSPEMYELAAVGGNGGWVDAAKRVQLDEIDLGNTGVLTRPYVVTSWTDEEQADVYPLIDYGSFAGRASSYDVPFEKLRPAVRVHRALKKFFNDNGYTVEAKGSFANLWKKIILPNTTGRIQVAQSYLTDNTAVVRTVGQSLSGGNNALSVDVVVSDPNSNITGNNYVAPYAQSMAYDISLEIDASWSVSGSVLRFITVQPYNLTAGVPMGVARTYEAGGSQVGAWTLNRSIVDTFTIEGFNDTSVSDNIEIRVFVSGTGLSFATVNRAEVTHRPTNIEYQKNLAIEIGPTMPRVRVSDLIKSLVALQNLVVITNDREHRVEFWRLDDYLKGREQGLDWSDRIHHTEDFGRTQEELPIRVEFRMAADDKDFVAQEYREKNSLGLGDANKDIAAGWADPYTVESVFAATHTKATFDGLSVPTIWRLEGVFQEDNYECEPRILVFDGLAPGSWTYDGTGETTYPIADQSGQSGALAFGPVNGITGTADTHWSRRLRWMGDGRAMVAEVMLWDHETASGILDLGKPVYLQWGDGGGWFYVTEIEQKRYGVHEPTRCTFIPLT